MLILVYRRAVFRISWNKNFHEGKMKSFYSKSLRTEFLTLKIKIGTWIQLVENKILLKQVCIDQKGFFFQILKLIITIYMIAINYSLHWSFYRESLLQKKTFTHGKYIIQFRITVRLGLDRAKDNNEVLLTDIYNGVKEALNQVSSKKLRSKCHLYRLHSIPDIDFPKLWILRFNFKFISFKMWKNW